MRVVCLSVCLRRVKAALFSSAQCQAWNFSGCSFCLPQLAILHPILSFVCVCVCLCVWVLNAIITMAHRCCYLLHIEPTDSYRACVRAGCIEMKVRRRHKLWLSCVACGSCVTSRHSCYNTCDPYCLTGCQSPSVCYIDSSMSKILKI